MTIRFRTSSGTFETDTANEMAAVIRALGLKFSEGDAPHNPAHAPAIDMSGPARLRRLYRSFPERQQRVIDLLRAGQTGVQDAELMAPLGFTTNNELAGTLAGLSKRAKSQGFRPDDVYTSTRERGVFGEVHYVYRLSQPMAEALERQSDDAESETR